MEQLNGRQVQIDGGLMAFVPAPLPSEVKWQVHYHSLLPHASYHLGYLNGMMEHDKAYELYVSPLVKLESVHSAHIENAYLSFSDLLIFEATKMELRENVREVANYAKAIDYGFERLKEVPFNLALLKEVHKVLLEGLKIETKPGEFRDIQNWIGYPDVSSAKSIYIPPPPDEMMRCMEEFEKFMTSEQGIHPLVKAAMLHYQFEAIHPFLYRNGRLGRLLVLLYLRHRGMLSSPVLYLSRFFSKNKDDYYESMAKVTSQTAWVDWTEFFLRGVFEQSQDAAHRMRNLADTRSELLKKLASAKAPPAAEKALDVMFGNPALTANHIAKSLGLTFPAANAALKLFESLEMVGEITGQKRNRIYASEQILRIYER